MFQHRRNHRDDSLINAIHCNYSLYCNWFCLCQSSRVISPGEGAAQKPSLTNNQDFNNSEDIFTQLNMMKNTLILVLFPLFAIGVFGVELKSVFVKEGDSVTLHTGVQIKASDEIEWRLNGKLIFRVSSSASGEITILDKTDGPFRDGLQVDKLTGDLKITNTKTTDSGEYKLKIRSTRGSSETTFSVTGVSDRDPVKSVTEGESITLKTQIQSDEVIQWMFGAENTLIAEINLMYNNITIYDDVPDGRFRGRLKLDEHTGSLTIMNIRDTDSGVYKADIRNSSFTIHKTFTVAVSDPSPKTTEITVIVILILIVIVLVIVIMKGRYRSSSSNVNGPNRPVKEEETELSK